MPKKKDEAAQDEGKVWPEVHTHQEADAQAAERGIEWPETVNPGPEGRLSIQTKQAILAGASVDPKLKQGMRA